MRALPITLAAAAILAGCGGGGTNLVDAGKLNSGNFPTSPQQVQEGTGFAESIYREGRRLGDHVPLAYEVDPQLTFGRGWAGLISTAAKPPNGSVTVSSSKFGADAPGFVVGWSVSGQRRRGLSDGRELTQSVLRFDGDTSAAHAAGALLATRLAQKDTVPLAIPGYPAARGAWKGAASQRSAHYYAWAASGSLVLFAGLYDPVTVPPDPAVGAQRIGQALAKQAEYLRGYQPTPRDRITGLPTDTDGLLSRTLPRDGKPSTSLDPPGIYTVRGAAASTYDPRDTMAAFRAAGAEFVAARGSVVTRARDASAARGLVSKLSKRYPDDVDAAPPPPDMPGTECVRLKDKTDGNRSFLGPFTCYTSYDRYFAMVGGANPQDTYQRTAAQYKILASGK